MRIKEKKLLVDSASNRIIRATTEERKLIAGEIANLNK